MAESTVESLTGEADKAPPNDYRLIVPNDWFRIPLEPDQWKRSVRALIDNALRGQDDAVVIKRKLTKELNARAEDAYRNGGVELYISTTSIGPVPLSASLLVTVIPPDEDLGLTVTGKQRAQEIDEVLLPFAGPAIRRRTRVIPADDDSHGNRLPVTTVDYAVMIPMTTASLLLTFSTSLDPFAEAMVDLFEAIANSLSWT
ncbi:hypothetical protein [Streptomyces triticiradicis]|uniref:hypothetical protein n=1 Tax=Streptomyces triticiradicis TaxID=2651189 RepID=UPI001CED3775|nr:hypothetical protein [Streptomyces triticiradicis]